MSPRKKNTATASRKHEIIPDLSVPGGDLRLSHLTDEPEAVSPKRKGPKPQYQREAKSAFHTLLKLSSHFIVVLFIVGLGFLMHLLLIHVLGDPFFFDVIPIRWVIDLGDLAIILAFIGVVLKELMKSGKR